MVVTILTLVAAMFVQSAQAPAKPAAERFDYLVRADFFAGVAGDTARLRKMMDLCERTLAENPKHPEAMVWHGAAVLVQSAMAFQKGDMATGGPLFDRGIREMDAAVLLAPDNPGVLIPRGAVLFEATRGMPPAVAQPLVESALANYEHVLEVQKPYWKTLSDHGRGELLFGLAEGSARLGRQDRAREYFAQLLADAPTSGQTPKAKEWMTSGTIPKSNGPSCAGCHK